MKDFFVFSITIATLCCCLICSYGYDVSSVSQLVSLFDAQSQGTLTQNINLLSDLDFSTFKMTYPLGGKASGGCVTFNGVLSGNGHTVRGLVMDNKGKTSFSNASLFCKLGNVTVSDLIIDGSCSFVGKSAGALAATVSGSVTLRGVTNYASVTGENDVGGLIGIIQSTSKATVSFESCANYGNVTGTYVGTQNRAGGMIGFARDNTNLRVNIYDSVNNGTITGVSTYCGGFIGYFFNNNVFTIEMNNCTNYGTVKGSHYAAGFISVFWTNVDGSVTLTKVTNYGKVTGMDDMGGVIGSVSGNKGMEVNIIRSTNAGNVSGLSYVGGFVGTFSSLIDTKATLVIKGCNNLGHINANSKYACGIFCHKPSGTNPQLITQVINTVNKGTITGERSCGISNNLTGAANVVGFGAVEESQYSYSLWETIQTSSSTPYVLNTTCVNCRTMIKFGQSLVNGLYYQVGSSPERMDVKLTSYAKTKRYDGVWTSKLDVVDKYLTVKIGTPVGLDIYVTPSSSLGDIDVLQPYFSGNYILVNSQDSSVQYSSETVVTTDIGIKIVQACNVTIGAPVNTVVRVPRGSLLGDVDALKPYFVSKYAIVDSQNNETIFNKSTAVLQNMSVSIICKLRVVIEIPPVEKNSINEIDIANALSNMTNKSLGNFSMDFISDETGNVTHIDVYVFDTETANRIVDAMKDIDKEDCSFGLLCQSRNVFIDESDPSLASFVSIPSFVFILIFSSILFHVMAW